MNRHYTSDKSKWNTRSHLRGPATETNSAWRISGWIFDPGPDLEAPVSRAHAAYSMTLSALDELDAKKSELIAQGKLTPLGISEHLAEHSIKNGLSRIRRARAILDDIRDGIEARAAKMTVPTLDPASEPSRAELRTMMRGMSDAERDKFISANRSDPDVVAAIISTKPQLSGITALQHQNIRNEEIQRLHSETIAELQDLDEVIGVADKVVDLGREAVRDILGVDRELFNQIARVAESNRGQMPFRVESMIDGEGRRVDVAKVVDRETREWRTATSDEVASHHQAA